MNVQVLREDFPVLRNREIIYFDNAATSLTPDSVIKAVNGYYKKYCANVHRGPHKLSQEASRAYEKAHRKVANFFGKRSLENVVFTRNTTEALNMIAHGLDFDKEDEILVDEMSHHSNMLPFRALTKAKVNYIKVKRDGTLDMSDLKEKLNKKTKLVVVTHVSNALGTINPIKKISKLAHEVGAHLVVDGAQSAPHMKVDVEELGTDFFAFSGHKMLGPTGIGGLVAKKHLLEELNPTYYGGGMIKKVEFDKFELGELPWKFEAGTPAIAQGIGLGDAVDYLNERGIKKIRKHEKELLRYLIPKLKELKEVEIYGPLDPQQRGGLVIFNVKNLNPHDVAMLFDEKSSIALRSGGLCAEPIVIRYNKEGVVRASFYLYNTKKEVDKFLRVLKEVAKEGKGILF